MCSGYFYVNSKLGNITIVQRGETNFFIPHTLCTPQTLKTTPTTTTRRLLCEGKRRRERG